MREGAFRGATSTAACPHVGGGSTVENFSAPNPSLVFEVLYWLVLRYDSSANVSDAVESEQDRIDFLTSCAQIFASKARIKLNTKRLYGSDGKAVRELLKVASMLYSAMRANDDGEAGGDVDDESATLAPKLQVRGQIWGRGPHLRGGGRGAQDACLTAPQSRTRII